MKNVKKWAPSAIAGLAGIGLGYYFGSRRTTSPAGLASGTPTWSPSARGSAGMQVWAAFGALYGPSYSAQRLCVAWSGLNIATKRQLVTQIIRTNRIPTGGFSTDDIIGEINQYVAACISAPAGPPPSPSPSPTLPAPAPMPRGPTLTQVGSQTRQLMAEIQAILATRQQTVMSASYAWTCANWPSASGTDKSAIVSVTLAATRSTDIGAGYNFYATYANTPYVPFDVAMPPGINAGGFSISQIVAEIDRQCAAGVPLGSVSIPQAA